MTAQKPDLAVKHGLEAVELMKAVYPSARQPAIAHMQQSLAQLHDTCEDAGLLARLGQAIIESAVTMTVHYGDSAGAWSRPQQQ